MQHNYKKSSFSEKIQKTRKIWKISIDTKKDNFKFLHKFKSVNKQSKRFNIRWTGYIKYLNQL